jgi:lysozyme family protein
MSKQFDNAFDLIIGVEGGFVDNKADHGGATNWGITISTLSSVLGRTATVIDVKSLTKESAKRIYLEKYWSKMSLDLVASELLQQLIFDQCVNFGCGKIVSRLQDILKIPKTILIDQATIKAINECDRLKLAFDFVKATQKAYIDIVKHDQTQLVFVSGWLNRSFKLLDLIRQSVELKV